MKPGYILVAAALLFATPAAAQPHSAHEAQAVAAAPGVYELDPNHRSLLFKIRHLQLGDYVAYFTDFTAAVTLDFDNPQASSVVVKLNPASVRTTYQADYRAAHPQRPYQNFEDDLAHAPEYFNTNVFPEAAFRSTSVERTGPNTARIVGDLTFLGQTHAITLEAEITGATERHIVAGRPAIGLRAHGSFSRGQFGNTYLANGFVGDEVTIEFNGDFIQPAS